MSSKRQDGPPDQAAITPRRLRSGNHYGNQATQPLVAPNRKDSRRVFKEIRHPFDSDSNGKVKAHKTTAVSVDSPAQWSADRHFSVGVTDDSPKALAKGQTLKAILESIKPNLALKNKSVKRKTLRDLLDQKISHDKATLEEKSSTRELSLSETRSTKPEMSRNVEEGQVLCDKSREQDGDFKIKRELPVAQTTAHTQTALETKIGDGIVKEEPPDDYWAMNMNYRDRSVAKISSVELKIKSSGPGDQGDDRSQTFRISCSRPENVDDKSPAAALRRNMKPDIVLKVRPRSSSLSALNRASLETRLPVRKTMGRFEERLDSESIVFSTVSPLSFKRQSSLQLKQEPGTSPGDGLVDRSYHCSTLSLLGAATADLAAHVVYGGEHNHNHNHGVAAVSAAAKSLNFDLLGQEDVVEESKLPPVDNTVELLSEPHPWHQHHQHTHPYHHDSYDPSFPHLTDYLHPQNSSRHHHHHHHHHGHNHHHHHHHHGLDGAQRLQQSLVIPEPLEPAVAVKTESCQPYEGNIEPRASGDEGRSGSLPWKEEPAAGVTSEGVDSRADEAQELNRFLARTEEKKKKKKAPSQATGEWDREADRERRPLVVNNDRYNSQGQAAGLQLPGRRRDSSSVPPTRIMDESGTRRRRKGRPSRRDKNERNWQASELGVASQEGEEGGEDPDAPVCEEKEFTARSRSGRALPSGTGLHSRKGWGKRQGDKAFGGRRARKSVDLETLWANPELDTHAFLLWASENRGESQRQNPEMAGPEVESLLTSQWRRLPFSGKMNFLCRARDADTDHNKHVVRRKRVPAQRKDPTAAGSGAGSGGGSGCASDRDGRSVYQEFVRLPQERQKDLLRKWLRFFQKMLPRLEYQDFIGDFKKACKTLQLRPVPARRKNARLRNLDPSHYHMLFEKIRETRPRVISVYNKRKAREQQLLAQSFSAMVRRLIYGHPWPFVRGCRSKSLGELLKDIQQLEVEEVLAQIDLPVSLTSADLPPPFLPAKEPLELNSTPSSSSGDGGAERQFEDSIHCRLGTGQGPVKDGHATRKGLAINVISSATNNSSNNNGNSNTIPTTHITVNTSTTTTTNNNNDTNSNNNNNSIINGSRDTNPSSGVGNNPTVPPSALTPSSTPNNPNSTLTSNNPNGPTSTSSLTSTMTLVPTPTPGQPVLSGPCGGGGDPDAATESPLALSLLEGLRRAADPLPLLDQRCLDCVFLGPPGRGGGAGSGGGAGAGAGAGGRTQASRDTQFQNSATYRRTLLYKHIQPLLDARGLPLPSSALYRSHSAQYFYPEDR